MAAWVDVLKANSWIIYLSIYFAAMITERGKSVECSGLLGWVRPRGESTPQPPQRWGESSWGSEPCWGDPLLPQQTVVKQGLKIPEILTYLICSPDSSRSELLFTSANETQLPARGMEQPLSAALP